MARKSSGPWFWAGRNTWFVWADGKQVNLRVRGEDNEKEAVRAWHLLMGGVHPGGATGGTPAAERVIPEKTRKAAPKPRPAPAAVAPTTTTVNVQQVIDRYLDRQAARIKPNSLRWVKRQLVPFAHTFAARTPADMSADDLERWARQPGWGQTTRRHAVMNVRSALHWAVKKKIIGSDPFVGAEPPPVVSRGAGAVITANEYERLLAGAWPAFKPLLTALWYTGARPGELAGLACDDVTADGNMIQVKQHKTSHKGQSRTLFLSDEAATFFRHHAAGRTGLLFVNRYGRRWSADNLAVAMRTTAARAGITGKTAYGFRHAYATEALARGVPDATVAALLDHANAKMLHKHYSHLTDSTDVLVAAAGKIR